MGASLNIIDIMALGFNGVFYIAILMTLTICTTYFIGRKLGFGEKYSLLMSAGNAVCGSSAIGSVSPVIKAKDSDKVICHNNSKCNRYNINDTFTINHIYFI